MPGAGASPKVANPGRQMLDTQIDVASVTLKDAIRRTQATLGSAGIPDARLEAEVLLASVLAMPRHLIYVYPEEGVSPQQGQMLARMVERRLAREPLAYVLGHWEFYGLDFAVGTDALIPRPETELLVERALVLAGTRPVPEEVVIAEAGTGSGAISISLALHLPLARIYATDLSQDALAMARLNAARHGVADRVALLQGDLLEPVPPRADLIVANLPYLPTGRIDSLQPEIRWEPRMALDGGPDGLGLIRRLLHQAVDRIKAGGSILLEIEPEQVGPLEALARELFPGGTTVVRQDLAHLDRVFEIDLA